MPVLPVLYAPDSQTSTPLISWTHDNLASLARELRENGAVLLRGFHTPQPDTAQQLFALFGAETMDNVFWSTPRTLVTGRTFTATEYPAHQHIPLHSEMSYRRRFPRLLVFHALGCADRGGTTTLADLDAVSKSVPELTDEIRAREVTYVRTFHPGIDIPLATAFGTDDPGQIAELAAADDMTIQHTDTGIPQIIHTAQGTLTDTDTGNPIWFNQLHLYHPASLPEPLRRSMRQLFGDKPLPRQAFYGDGQPIAADTVEAITAAFAINTTEVSWSPSDVLIVDNLRYAHGRTPFTGPRRLHVAMGIPHDSPNRPPICRADDVIGSC